MNKQINKWINKSICKSILQNNGNPDWSRICWTLKIIIFAQIRIHPEHYIPSISDISKSKVDLKGAKIWKNI